MINGATNHSFDRDFEGVKAASQTWRQYQDIIYTGTYDSQSDRDTIRIIEKTVSNLHFYLIPKVSMNIILILISC